MPSRNLASSSPRPVTRRGRPTAFLRDPAPRTIRVVALALLDVAYDAARRLREGSAVDADQLHQFRVALRRLRSWLQLWRGPLEDSLSRRDARRVRAIARATSEARDLDVHHAWLSDEFCAATSGRRAAIAELMALLEARRGAATATALDAANELEARYARLHRRLETYRVHVQAETEEPFGVALVAIVHAASESLRAHLAAVRSADDQDEAHRARIAAKRLRYLLEPVADVVRGVPTLIDDLRSLQDTVGDLRDAHVFSTELALDVGHLARPRPRLVERHLAARGARAYTRFERDWLGDASVPFFARIARAASLLARPARVPTKRAGRRHT